MYSRFTALEGYGEEELERVQNSTAAVVGLGSTGSVIAENLARHGVNLVLIDQDYLELKDLYTSGIYSRKQCENSLPKAFAAEKNLSELADIESHLTTLRPENRDILDGCDIIMDGTDNMETRLLLDRYSKEKGTPWVYTAAIRQKGYSMFFDEKCFHCLFSDSTGIDGKCGEEGIMREIAEMAATLSSLRAVRYLSGKKVDEELETVPERETLEPCQQGCRVCSNEERSERNYPEIKSSRLCGENKYRLNTEAEKESIEKAREKYEVISENSFLVRFLIEGREVTYFRTGYFTVESDEREAAEELVRRKFLQ